MANGEHVHGELRLRCGLRVEEFDGEVVVLDPDGNAVHRVEGDGVAAVRLLQSVVATAEVPPELVDAVAALVEAGLVDDGRRVSRRAALATGGGVALAAATVTTFALADPAAALSMYANGFVTDAGMAYGPGDTFATFTTGPGGSMSTVDVIIRAWGGGGGGGQSDAGSSLGGGGGGGGGYAYTVQALPECRRHNFNLWVGSGGMGGNGGSATSGDYSVVDDGAAPIVVAEGGTFGNAGTGGMWGAGGTGGHGLVGTTLRGGGKGAYGDPEGGGGGGSAGHGGDGGNAGLGGNNRNAGAAGLGSPAGAVGGTGGQYANGAGGPGNPPGSGGGGAGGDNNAIDGPTPGGDGGAGQVWIGM